MSSMDVDLEVMRVLDEVLSLGGRSATYTRETRLLGAVPQFDSMAVVSLITRLEEHFSILIADDEIDSDTFATVGSLADFVSERTAG